MNLNEKMIPIYTNLVRNDRRSIEQIPEAYRQAVQESLAEKEA